MNQCEWERDITTRSGFKFHVRPARADDETDLADFFKHVKPEDLRFRFLTTMKEVGHDRLVDLTKFDRLTDNFLACGANEGSILAVATLACDAALEKGEVAISIREEDKHKGIGWELLCHISRFAEAKGLKVIESLEDRENREAIQLEHEQGFDAHPCPDDSHLVILRKTLAESRPRP